MNQQSGPVKSFPLAEQALRDFAAMRNEANHTPPSPGTPAPSSLPDFTDTERTFSHLSTKELKRAAMLFRLMGQSWLTGLLSGLGLQAVKYNLPGASWAVRKSIFPQFVGGTSFLDSLPVIERLYERRVTSILDFGAEAKNTDAAFDQFTNEVLQALEFSGQNPAAVAGVVKVSGLAHDEMLARLNGEVPNLSANIADHPRLQNTFARLDRICAHAARHGVQVYIDAEESWVQGTIDALATELMRRYNRGRVVVINTFQLYRHDRLAYLRESYRLAEEGGYRLGAKLVRGAYMVKENHRASALAYPTPIQPSLEATHSDFNAALRFCIERHDTVHCTVGSHNVESTTLACRLMAEYGLAPGNESIRFAQLYGMSDNLTFNLAEAGYRVSKYMVYGPVKEVLPYLVRRAQENASVTGEVGRELGLIRRELARRAAAR